MMHRVRNAWLVLPILVLGCNLACSSRSDPQERLIGKWQADTPSNKAVSHKASPSQFQFFADGTIVEYGNIFGRPEQYAGNFKFADSSHIRIELQPHWVFGMKVYEVTWNDKDHVTLQAGDENLRLTRLQ